MIVSRTNWHQWEAVRCSSGPYELMVGISAGPRILSFSRNGGNNVLYKDETGFGVGAWRIYGGHRFTTAPENENSYLPDNKPCDIKMDDSRLRVSAPQRPDGLRLSLEISAFADGFKVKHILQNHADKEWTGALWAITCVLRHADLFAAICTREINYSPATDASKWKQNDGYITVDKGSFRGKVGWHHPTPLLKAVHALDTFVISSPDASVKERCVDNRSNTEIFVCTDFAELETLSEAVTVAPGGSACHVPHWQLLPSV